MDGSRRPSGQSPPSPFSLPSFGSISGNASHQSTSPPARRDSIHDTSVDLIQTMRQQINARDQSIAILRTEQERAQSRYEALETKSQVMDHEVAVLTEENGELRQRINSLASQVERLTQDKEELQNQTQADAAQWRQIMSMSSRLQMQSMEESRRFNAEREAWTRERGRLEQRITELSGYAVQWSKAGENFGGSPGLHWTSTVSSMSDDQLRHEVIRLRERCREFEELLTAVAKESASIERADVLIREVKRRMMSAAGRRVDEGPSSSDP